MYVCMCLRECVYAHVCAIWIDAFMSAYNKKAIKYHKQADYKTKKPIRRTASKREWP